MADHDLGARRVGARQHLCAGQGVVEKVRLDLRMQQIQARHGQFLFHDRLLGGGLFVATLLADPAHHRAIDRLGVFVIAAFVHRKQIHPGASVRLAQHGDAAGALPRRDRRQDLVVGDGKAREQVPARRLATCVRVDAAHLGANQQAARRAFDVLHAR